MRREKHIPISYQTERARNAMLDDLRKFAADRQWPRADYQSRTEEKFEFPLDGFGRRFGARSTAWMSRPTAAPL